jgi:hypothetical protein
MSRSASSGVPGYLSVSGAGQVLHLAPRSIRDLIYAGRLPSVRLGRRHFLSATDIEAERRRRLRLAPRQPRVVRERPARGPRLRRVADPDARQRRAGERAAVLDRWRGAPGSTPLEPALSFAWQAAPEAGTCSACGHGVAMGQSVLCAASPAVSGWLCATCGRRALLAWADQRTQQASAARRLARAPTRRAGPRVQPPVAEVELRASPISGRADLAA